MSGRPSDEVGLISRKDLDGACWALARFIGWNSSLMNVESRNEVRLALVLFS